MAEPAAAERARFSIVVEADIAPQVLERYWAGSIDKFGKAQFDESVASIANDLGVGVQDITRLAKATGYGHRPSWTCHYCGGPWPLRTRTAHSPQKQRCDRCLAAAAADAEAQAAAEAATWNRRARLVAERLTRGPEHRPVRVDIGDITALPFPDVIALATWLTQTGPDGILPAVSERPVDLFADTGTAKRLYDSGLVRLDPSSSVDAFYWTDETDRLPDFKTTAARYHLPGAGPVADRTSVALDELTAALSTPWPSHWVEGAIEATRLCLQAEICRRMDTLLWGYDMDVPTEKQWEKLRGFAEEALKTFTLGQCLTATDDAAETAAALTRKKRKMSATAASGRAVNKFADYIQRALDGDWDVFEAGRRDDAPLSVETELLAAVLGLNPMMMRITDGRDAAGPKIDAATSLRRLIAQGLPKRWAEGAVSRFGASGARDVGNDFLLEALRHRIRTICDHGGTHATAICAALAAVDLLRDVGAYPDAELDACERALIEAVIEARPVGPG